MSFRLSLLAVLTVALCFLLYIEYPYTILSDSGYQALSAYQFLTHRVSALNYLSLVNPHDLTRNVECALTDWAAFSTYLFFVVFKTGLAPGPAGRLIAFLACAAGAIGWSWVASMIGLKGAWRVAGVILASAYCLLTGLILTMGTQDYLIYAVAPWLIVAGFRLTASDGPIQTRTLIQTTLLCAALGSVYWLKYTGIFLSLAILVFLLLGQARGLMQRSVPVALLVLACYGAAFVLPVLGQKADNYRRSGTDVIERVISHHRHKTPELIRQYISETLADGSITLFTVQAGAERFTQGHEEGALPWIVRLPGIFLLLVCLAAFWLFPQWGPGKLASLIAAVPVIGFPVLSSITGFRYVASFYHSTAPSWIFLELVILALISRQSLRVRSGYRWAITALAVATAMHMALFLWAPKTQLQNALHLARQPRYAASAKSLSVVDISRLGTREVDSQIKSLIHSPNDVLVPAVYSNRGFGTDVWLELTDFGRLLPLSLYPVAIARTQGEGASFYGKSSFESSGPVRIILLATDTYHRNDFQSLIEQIRERFKNTDAWTSVPAVPPDPDDRPHLWTTEMQGNTQARQ